MRPFSPGFAGALFCLLEVTSLPASPASDDGTRDAPARREIATLIERAMDTSPKIAAARAAITVAQARLAGAGLPLNNPELEAEAERTDVGTYRLGINQTIDWYDKRGAQERVARQQVELARQKYESLKLERSRKLLEAIGRISVLHESGRLARERTKVLKRFKRLARKRHAVGDIPQADVQLANLSFAEAAMREARLRSELILAKTDFEVLSGFRLEEIPTLPSMAFTLPSPADDEGLVEQHPEVKAALIAAQVARRQILNADRGRKADPRLGVAAGKDGDNALLGLTFSIPLQVRNNFDSNVRAARAEALQAERLARQAYVRLQARLRGARAQYQVIATAWKAWLETGQSSLRRRIELLDTLWAAGEIQTSDYLLQLEQTLDTRITGTELRGDLWKAWVAWLADSGTLLNQMRSWI